MVNMRRITVPEADAVAALWDRMCRELADGGPLTPPGRAHIARMLAGSAFHHQTACLVAVEDSTVSAVDVSTVSAVDVSTVSAVDVSTVSAVDVSTVSAVDVSTVLGFVVTRVDPGDGLLPGLAGEISELYVVPEERGRGISRALAAAAVAWLRERDVWTVRTLVCADALADQQFWVRQGFEADMVCLSSYRDD